MAEFLLSSYLVITIADRAGYDGDGGAGGGELPIKVAYQADIHDLGSKRCWE